MGQGRQPCRQVDRLGKAHRLIGGLTAFLEFPGPPLCGPVFFEGGYRPGDSSNQSCVRINQRARPAFGPWLLTRLRISAEQNSTITCALDSDTYTSCPAAPSFANLEEGTHTLSVKQTDRAGNTSQAATYTWSIDLTAPAAPVISSGPPAKTNLATAVFTFTNPDLAPLTCSLDGAAFKICTSGLTYLALAEGKHTFQVRTSDSAGNTATTSQSWRVDTTPPILNYSARGGKIKTSTSTSYQLIVSPDPSGIVAVEYSTAIAAPSLIAKNVAAQTIPYAEPTVFTTTATIRWIRLQDGAGNWSRWFIG